VASVSKFVKTGLYKSMWFHFSILMFQISVNWMQESTYKRRLEWANSE